LKTLSIVAATPDESLAELAELVEEVAALPGEVVDDNRVLKSERD